MNRSEAHRRARLPLSLLTIVVLVGCSAPQTDTRVVRAENGESDRLELSSLLAGDAGGFARAIRSRAFEFPADHGAHPEFRTEWWYLTGNLTTGSSRRFGYQFTLFRNALAADSPPRESGWATRQAFMGHLALTDVDRGRFYYFERFARGAAGLAGVEIEPFRAWLEDWELSSRSSSPPFRLQAATSDIALDLELDALKPLVLQGEAGLSRKGRETGNASYYYAYTRLQTTGRLQLAGLDLPVEGTSWLDREWSTSALEAGQRGWDWLALQLDDGTDVMVYQMRRDDGSVDPISSGSLVESSGGRTGLRWPDFRIEVLGWWTSGETAVRYPSGWRLRIPSTGLDLEIEPMLKDQELRLSVLYWEGAVKAFGTHRDSPVAGQGYVELTGYGPR